MTLAANDLVKRRISGFVGKKKRKKNYSQIIRFKTLKNGSCEEEQEITENQMKGTTITINSFAPNNLTKKETLQQEQGYQAPRKTQIFKNLAN